MQTHRFIATAAATIILSTLYAHVQAGTYVAECGLDDGSKFVLRAEYSRNWIPSRHNGPTSVKDGWNVFYKAKGHRRETQAPGSIKYAGRDNVDCSGLGRVSGTPVILFSFLDKRGQWFSSRLLPQEVYSYGTPQYRPAAIRQQLAEQQLDISYHEGFVAPFDDKIVYEAPVLQTTTPDGIVTAVLQTVSSDNGKTWSEPTITKDARIYELGKSPKAQRFLATPRH